MGNRGKPTARICSDNPHADRPSQARLKTRLLPTKCRSTFRRRAPAASALPLVLSRVHWVRPELVAEVKYLSWTDDNLLRLVVYEGLREEAGGRLRFAG